MIDNNGKSQPMHGSKHSARRSNGKNVWQTLRRLQDSKVGSSNPASSSFLGGNEITKKVSCVWKRLANHVLLQGGSVASKSRINGHRREDKAEG